MIRKHLGALALTLTTALRLVPARGCVAAAAVLASTFAAPARLAAQERAAPMELSALLAEAEANNPEILASNKAAAAAAARVPQAGALPDPMLEAGIANLPIADPRLGQDFMTMAMVGVSGVLPFPGKLGLREDVAGFLAEAAKWEAERVRQRVLAEVKTAYYHIYFVDRALEVTRRNEALVADFARLTSAKYGVGTGAQPDVLRAQVERTRLEDQFVALRKQRASAAARLNALLARPSETPVPRVEMPAGVRIAALEDARGEATFVSAALGNVAGPAPGLPSVAELQRMALENNPMIQAHVRRVEAQKKTVSLAEKAKLPDFRVSLGYAQRTGFGDMLNAKVSVPLPLFAGRKQDQQVVEEAAILAEHQARHHAMVNEVNAQIASLAAALQRARSQLVLLNEGILPQAHASLASATSAYRVGRVDFLSLLDSQVTLYRHELDYHRLLADFAQNLATLERAVGKELLP